MCTNDEKHFPMLIENQVVGDAFPPSPMTTQKPDTTEFDAANECAPAAPEFPAEGVLKRLRQTPCNRVADDGVWQHDAMSEKPAVKDAVDLVDAAANAGTQRGDNLSVDPQLHLLDFQLRHILKSSPSARDEGSSAACDVPGAKTKNAVEGSPSRSFAHSRSILSQPAVTRDYNVTSVDQCSRKPPHSGSARCELADRQVSGRSDEHCSAVAHVEATRGRSSRSVERGRRPSYGRKDANEDGAMQPADDKGDVKKLSVDAAGSGGITFGGVEELSYGNVQAEDLPTTNIYLDDHATKAAPYTIASQFYTLGSEAEDDDGSEGVPDRKMDDEGTCNISPSACHTAEKPRRPITLARQTLSVADKANEHPTLQHDSVWRRCSSANTAVVTRALSANDPLTPDAFPRPKFSVRSPSSPARLASDVVIDSKPHQITVEPASKQGIVSNVSPSRDNCAPLAAQEPDGSEANSATDVEAGVFELPSGTAVAQKLAITLNAKSEPRGAADGESPRIPCEVIDGSGDAAQRSEVSDRMSSCSAELAGIAFCAGVSPHQRVHEMNMFTKPTADFPNIAQTSKVVPMAVAKKIADCLDVSLGSDKELKEIMRNGVPAVDKVDRTMSGAPMSRFAVVSKTVMENFDSPSKVPNSATSILEPVAVNTASVPVPSVPDSVPANTLAVSDVRTDGSAPGQLCLSTVAHGRCDDVSDSGSLVLVKTEPFSSPDRLPRPPSGRVSKKAAIANRARYVPSDRICEILFPFLPCDAMRSVDYHHHHHRRFCVHLQK